MAKRIQEKKSVWGILSILSIAAIVLAVANISVTLIRMSDFQEKLILTGLATGTGEVNLTVETEASINMSNDITSWGSGVVDTGAFNASLFTATTEKVGNVTNGNWSVTNAKGLFLENRGNVNVTIKIEGDTNSSGLFGSSSGTNEGIYINVSNNGSSGCSGGDYAVSIWDDINTTTGGAKYCGTLDYHDGINSIYIDTYLEVPYDATNVSTQLALILTATGTANP